MILHLINEILVFFTGFFFNIALLYLIHKRTPSLMRPYTTVLKVHAISDFLSDIVNFVTSTHCVSLNGRFFFINGGFHAKYWTKNMAFISVETYLWIAIYAPLGLVPLDFYYRLKAVCYGDLISKKFVTIWVACVYSISFIIAFPINGLYMKVGPSNRTEIYDQILANALNVSRQQLSGYLTMGFKSPLEIGVLCLIVIVISLDYSFIVYVVWQIRKKMKESVDRNVPEKAKSIQKQVSRIMFVQAAIPLVLCVPMTINISVALFFTDIPSFAPIAFSIMCWLVALKPLTTICIVPHYRNTLFRMSSSINS